jgi:hypothetical protein
MFEEEIYKINGKSKSPRDDIFQKTLASLTGGRDDDNNIQLTTSRPQFVIFCFLKYVVPPGLKVSN